MLENLRKFIRKQEIQPEPVDVNRAILDVLNLIEADARAEGFRVAVHLEEGLPAVNANAVQLQQVVLNLTRNAVDAMRDSVGSEDLGIVIKTELARAAVRISVADHGPGVSRQIGDNIFHPFVTTKRSGLGVGLAISRTIVQAYGGTLTYRDNPAGGAIFVVELPLPQEVHH